MTLKKRADDFLKKAKEADEQAAKAKDLTIQESWKTIADGYRDLAKWESGS